MPSEYFPSVPEAPTHCLRGRRLLVIESDCMLATDLAEALERQGAQVIGPVARVEDALGLMASEDGIDGALIEVKLDGEHTFPVVDALRREGVPFVFVSGYDAWAISKAYDQAPHFEKPVDTNRLPPLLAEALWG